MKRGMKSFRLGVRLALYGALSGLAAPCLAQSVAQEGLREVSSLQTVRKDQRLMLGFSNAAQSAHSNGYVHNAAAVPPGAPGAAAAGLIGALVGAMLTRSGNVSRAEQVQQMNLLSDQALASLQNKLRPLLREELVARQLHETTELEHVDDPMDLDQPGMLRRIQEPLIMTSEFSCRFDESFKRLKISLAMKVWRKGELRPVRNSERVSATPSPS